MSLKPTTVVDAQRPTGLVDDSGAMLHSMDGVNGHGEQGAARIIEVGIFTQDAVPGLPFCFAEVAWRFRQFRRWFAGLKVPCPADQGEKLAARSGFSASLQHRDYSNFSNLAISPFPKKWNFQCLAQMRGDAAGARADQGSPIVPPALASISGGNAATLVV